MSQLGYKPTNLARGAGIMSPGESRVTYLGSFQQATWIIEVGFWGGYNAGSSVVAAPVFYDMAGPTSNPTALVYSPAPKTITNFMSGSDRATGTHQRWAVTGLGIAAGRTLGGGVWADDSAGTLGYGQNNGPHRMFYDESAPSVPNPFGVTKAQTEGQIDVWMIGQANRPPNAPGVVVPANGSAVVDPTPDITIAFSDPDEAFGDSFSAYKIEVRNRAGTVVLHTSGVVPTDAGEQAARRATWTVPGALAADTYGIRATTYDAFGVASLPASTTFTVNSGGIFEAVAIHPTWNVGTNAAGDTVVNETTQGVNTTWSHDSGLNTASVTSRIIDADTGLTVRSEQTVAYNLGPDVVQGWTYSDFPAWAPLPRGATRYRWQFKAADTLGSESPWASSDVFVVNSVPAVEYTAANPVDGKTVATYPKLTVTVADTTDAPGSHTVFVQWSDDGLVTETPHLMRHVGAGVYELQLTAGFMPALGDYTYYVSATDPWELDGTTAASRTLHLVAPPILTVTAPVDDSTVTTGTPTVTATVDRTINLYRVWITRAGSDTRLYDTLDLPGTGSTIAHAVPGATLPNATDYDLHIWVQTADGLEATSTTQFRVEYEAPWYMAGVTGAAVASSVYDEAGGPALQQTPNVALAWDAVDVATVSDADWIGYVIYRLGGEQDRQWTLPDRNQTDWTDTSPAGNVAYDYYVGYLSRINDGLDEIESRLVQVGVTPTVKHATITSESADDPAVTLHYWEDRDRRLVTDVEPVEILGQAQPDSWQSPVAYDEIDIEATALDDQSGAALYTARDIVEDADTLARPLVDRDGRLRPRALTWRDPRGRAIPFVITRFEERDHHRRDRAAFRLQGFQPHRDLILPASVNTDAARDMTGVVEPSLLLPLDGSLAGEDRAGPMTATGTGALRFVDGYSEGSQAALVEEGTTNLAINPSAEISLDHWFLTDATGTLSRVQTGVTSGDWAAQVVCPGTGGFEGIGTAGTWGMGLSGGGPVVCSVDLSGEGTVEHVYARVFYTDATNESSNGPGEITLTSTPERYATPVFWTDPTKTIDNIQLLMHKAGGGEAATIIADAVQIEQKAYATSYADGSLGPGYAWTGTAHASASTRAATTVTIPTPERHLGNEAGTVALRLRELPGPATAYLWSAGDYGGASFLGILRTGDSLEIRARVSGVFQAVANAAVATTDAFRDLIIDYTLDRMRLHVDGVTVIDVARTAFDPFAWADPTLANTHGFRKLLGPNLVVAGEATYDRPLTDDERDQLVSADQWAWNGLLATP